MSHPSHCKKCLPYIQSKFTLFWFKTITPCPITTGPAKKLAPIFLTSPLQVLEGSIKVSPEPSLLQAEQPQLSQPFLVAEVLQPSDHFCGLLWTRSNRSMSFLCWGLQSWTQDSGITRAEQRGRITSLDLLATLLLMELRIQLAAWAASTHCWVMLSFSSTNIPKSFSSGLLSILSPPSLYLCLGLPSPRCRTLHLVPLDSSCAELTSAVNKGRTQPEPLCGQWIHLLHFFPTLPGLQQYNS